MDKAVHIVFTGISIVFLTTIAAGYGWYGGKKWAGGNVSRVIDYQSRDCTSSESTAYRGEDV